MAPMVTLAPVSPKTTPASCKQGDEPARLIITRRPPSSIRTKVHETISESAGAPLNTSDFFRSGKVALASPAGMRGSANGLAGERCPPVGASVWRISAAGEHPASPIAAKIATAIDEPNLSASRDAMSTSCQGCTSRPIHTDPRLSLDRASMMSSILRSSLL